MSKSLIAFAAAMLVGAATAHAAPATFFGEDLNPKGDSGFLTAFPDATAARTSLFANLAAVGTETFEGIAGGTASPSVNFAVPGGTITATLTGGTVGTARTASNQYATSGTHFLNAGTGSFTITFSAPVSAFGFYGIDVGDFGDQLALQLTTPSKTTTSLTVPHVLGKCGGTPCSDATSGSVIYYGFYDTAATYSSISFINSGGTGRDVFGFDDFSVGTLAQVKPVPEPASMAVLACGLIGVGVARRRRA